MIGEVTTRKASSWNSSKNGNQCDSFSKHLFIFPFNLILMDIFLWQSITFLFHLRIFIERLMPHLSTRRPHSVCLLSTPAPQQP